MSFYMYDHYFDYYLQSIFGGTVDTEVKTKILAPYCHSEEPAARSINRDHWQLPYVGLINRAPLGTPLPAVTGFGVTSAGIGLYLNFVVTGSFANVDLWNNNPPPSVTPRSLRRGVSSVGKDNRSILG